MTKKTLTLEEIILEAGKNLEGAAQWLQSLDTIGRSAEYVAKAKVLIECAEVMICGSMGGFDKGQKGKDQRLLGRWRWLFTRYTTKMMSHSFGCLTAKEIISRFENLESGGL